MANVSHSKTERYNNSVYYDLGHQQNLFKDYMEKRKRTHLSPVPFTGNDCQKHVGKKYPVSGQPVFLCRWSPKDLMP